MARFTGLSLLALAFALAAGSVQAQSSITTLFASNNNGADGGIVYFDVLVAGNDLDITAIDYNTSTGAGTLAVYYKTGSYVGFEANAGAWTLHDTVTGITGAGTNLPTSAVLNTPLTLLASTQYAMALVATGTGGHFYTNGTGSNQQYINADIQLDLGAANNTPFAASPFSPRVWNGTLYYSFAAPAGDPEIAVSRTGGIGNGSTDNIGSIDTGVATPVTWTIDNQGATQNLDVTSISAAPSGVANCTVTASPVLVPASPIAPAGTATFDVDVTPTANGPFEFTITINNNDADEGTFTIIVQGTGVTTLALPFTQDFEGASPLAGWTVTNSHAPGWHVTTNFPNGGAACLGYCQNETQPSATADGDYDFGPGVANNGRVVSPPLSVPASGSHSLSFDVYTDTETSPYDLFSAGISLNGTTFDTTYYGPAGFGFSGYTTQTFDVSAYAGQVVYIMFYFDTTDGIANTTTGIRIDNVALAEPPEMDVLRGATPIADGGTDTVQILTAGSNLTYTIENTGGSDLNLTGTPDLVVVTAGTNITTVTVTTQPTSPVAGGGNTTFVINVVPTAAGPYDFTVSIDNNDSDENPYNFTVSGNAVSNVPPVVANQTGSNWVDAGGGLFTLTVNPGAAINDTLEATDATPDNMTVDVVTAATLTGLTGQPVDITTPTAGPISLTWTGTADATNTPGNYDWLIDINDGTSTTSITARIIVVDVAPQHTAATGISGDGSAGTPYLTTYAENDPATLTVNLANVTDGNTGQTLNLTNVAQSSGPTTGSGFTFTLLTGVLSVAPSATLVANDVGTQVFSMDIDDGTNTVTVNVSILVLGNSGAVVITNTSPLAAGTVGSVYATVTLTATGGTGPYTYSVISGALPAGLSLSATGDITGTPTAATTANFTVRAVDSLNDSGTKAFSITINAAGGGSGGSGGGGGGGGGGGCAAGNSGSTGMFALLGLLGLVALAFRLRVKRA